MLCMESDIASTTGQPDENPLDGEPLEMVRRALRGLRYGQVVVIVQDGVVIQVDRTERRRLRPSGRRNQ